MKVTATFARDGKWWVAWAEKVPGALTQGRTLAEARRNLIDAVREIRRPIETSKIVRRKVVREVLEV